MTHFSINESDNKRRPTLRPSTVHQPESALLTPSLGLWAKYACREAISLFTPNLPLPYQQVHFLFSRGRDYRRTVAGRRLATPQSSRLSGEDLELHVPSRGASQLCSWSTESVEFF